MATDEKKGVTVKIDAELHAEVNTKIDVNSFTLNDKAGSQEAFIET